MNKNILASLAFVASSSSLYANIEIELGAGQSKKVLKGLSGQEDVTITSPDLNFYIGYRLKSFPLSLGLAVSQKNYDIAEVSKQLAPLARIFYEDTDRFSSPADITSAESSGSWKGMVYGPQFSISTGWKRFDPYLRASYQVGTLKSVIDYQSTGNYIGDSVAYDFKIEDDLKASLTRFGLGFRIPMGISYVYVDYGIEKMKTTADKQTITMRTLQSGVDTTTSETSPGEGSDDLSGQVVNIGLGLNF